MAAVTLPKFSDPRDIDEFVGKLEAFVCQAFGEGPLAAEATLLLPAAGLPSGE